LGKELVLNGSGYDDRSRGGAISDRREWMADADNRR
jgi:hypothetical protein